ncbi:hypothetical protein HDU86_007022 [Geranomyces michiganensis]|nr:hypothetical protein HDU86_007022 [Geranomyces michiganensis]
MRPDAHKSKATKRWKAKHGVPTAGSASSSTASKPDTRHYEAASIGGNPDDNGPPAHSTIDDANEQQSNAFRYHEPTAEEILAADAGIDRETEELRLLIREAEEAEYDPSMYFQLKEERDWANDSTIIADAGTDEFNRSRLQIDFAALEGSLSRLPVHVRLNVSKADAMAVVEALGLGKQANDGSESEDEVREEATPQFLDEDEPVPTQTVVSPPSRSPGRDEDSALRSKTSAKGASTTNPSAPALVVPLPQPAVSSVPHIGLPHGNVGQQPADPERHAAVEEDDLGFLLGSEPSTPFPPLQVPQEGMLPAPQAPTTEIEDLKWLDDILK